MIDLVIQKREEIKPLSGLDRDEHQCGANCYYVQICKDFGLKMVLNLDALTDYQQKWGRKCSSEEIRDIVWDISQILFLEGIGPQPIKKVDLEIDGEKHYGMFIEHVDHVGYLDDDDEAELDLFYEFALIMQELGWDVADLHCRNIGYMNGRPVVVDGVGAVFFEEDSILEIKQIIDDYREYSTM